MRHFEFGFVTIGFVEDVLGKQDFNSCKYYTILNLPTKLNYNYKL